MIGPCAIGDGMDAAHYSATEILRDGRNIEICAFKPGDDDDLSAAVGRVSPLSLYRRFFTIKRGFSEREKQFFLNVDFVNHVALMAWTEEVGRRVIVGGGRYVVVQPGKAEVAFIVIDQYQGRAWADLCFVIWLVSLARRVSRRSLPRSCRKTLRC